jgi:hypothetical protein
MNAAGMEKYGPGKEDAAARVDAAAVTAGTITGNNQIELVEPRS